MPARTAVTPARIADHEFSAPSDRSAILRRRLAISASASPLARIFRKSDRCTATRLIEPSSSTSTARHGAVVVAHHIIQPHVVAAAGDDLGPDDPIGAGIARARQDLEVLAVIFVEVGDIGRDREPAKHIQQARLRRRRPCVSQRRPDRNLQHGLQVEHLVHHRRQRVEALRERRRVAGPHRRFQRRVQIMQRLIERGVGRYPPARADRGHRERNGRPRGRKQQRASRQS